MKGGHQPPNSGLQIDAPQAAPVWSRNTWLRNVTAWVNTASLDLRLRTLSASSSSTLGD